MDGAAWVFPFLVSVTHLFGAGVSGVSAALFFLAFLRERQLRTAWRAVGFLLLGVALLLFAIFPEVPFDPLVVSVFVAVELVGLSSIFWGVSMEPILSHLREVPTRERRRRLAALALPSSQLVPLAWAAGGLALVFLVAAAPLTRLYTPSVLAGLSALVVVATIRLKARRYRWERDGEAVRFLNFLPLLGYVFLLVRSSALVALLSPGWSGWPPAATAGILGLMAGATAAAFLFLGWWAWIFIRTRPFLRTSVVAVIAAVAAAVVSAVVLAAFIVLAVGSLFAYL